MGSRVVVITGCSSGIGRALCYALHAKANSKGIKLFRVFATARKLDSLQKLQEDGIEIVACDVILPASIEACRAAVISAAGSVDVLINNAGMQAIGPIVEQPLEHFRMVQDTNCTGPVQMIQAFAPAMIKQGSGLIVNICSVSSYVDLPLSAAYNASKSALLSVTNVLRMEVEPLGLHVMAVTAGLIASDIGAKTVCDVEQYYQTDSAYRPIADAIKRRMDVPSASGSVMSAERAAEEIVKAVMRPRPPREIVTGARARTALLAGFLQYWLWPGIVERKFSRMFGLDKLRAAALKT
ncbi:g2757 [Coccomyxa elongata]